jgi:hypothetical protein
VCNEPSLLCEFDDLGMFTLKPAVLDRIGGADVVLYTRGSNVYCWGNPGPNTGCSYQSIPAPADVRVNADCAAWGMPVVQAVGANIPCGGQAPGINAVCPSNTLC